MLTIGTNGNATCTVNKKYLRFSGYNFLLVSLGLISLVTSLSTESWVAYALFVGGILFCLSLSMRNQQLFEFSIFTLLTYVFTLEVVVHYLGHPINIRLRDLSLIPISLLLLRYSTKIFKSFSWWACTLGLFFLHVLGCDNTQYSWYSSFRKCNSLYYRHRIFFLLYDTAKVI